MHRYLSTLFILLLMPDIVAAETFNTDNMYESIISLIPAINIIGQLVGWCLFGYSVYMIKRDNELGKPLYLRILGILIATLLINAEEFMKVATRSVIGDEDVHYVGYIKGTADTAMLNSDGGALLLAFAFTIGLYGFFRGIYRVYEASSSNGLNNSVTSGIFQSLAALGLIHLEKLYQIVISTVWGY